MEPKVFEKLYSIQLQEAYSAQKQLVESLPEILNSCGKHLKQVLKDYSMDCKSNMNKIEVIARKNKSLKIKIENCDAVDELLEEAGDWMEEAGGSSLSDAGLIIIFKKVCHYEIAIYETMMSYARILGVEKAVNSFHDALIGKYAFNDRLDEICEEAGGVLVAK